MNGGRGVKESKWEKFRKQNRREGHRREEKTVAQGNRRKRNREFQEILMKFPGKVDNGPGNRRLNRGDGLDSGMAQGLCDSTKNQICVTET